MPPDRHRSSWHELWRTTRGVARSLRLYYGNSTRRAVMDRFYAQFVQPGDMVVLRHGLAAFIKIDVEGSEADALAGLSSPSPALSFEFTTIQPRVAATCIKRCAELGYTRYNAVLGESLTFVHDDWMGAEAI